MKKRVFSIILAAILIVSVCAVFAACGNKADTKATTAPTTAATAAAATTPAADNNNAGNNAVQQNNGAQQNNDAQQNSNDAAQQSAEGAEESDKTAATSAVYTGESAMTMQQAMDSVINYVGLEDGQSAQYGEKIAIPDGSVWHNVMIMDKNGELVASYYISDASGVIKTVTELEAYAYN